MVVAIVEGSVSLFSIRILSNELFISEYEALSAVG